MKYWIITAVVLALGRLYIGLNIPPEPMSFSDVYKDVAHLYMGGLFVTARMKNKKWLWSLFWGLGALEVVIAVLSRG